MDFVASVLEWFSSFYSCVYDSNAKSTLSMSSILSH